MKILQRLVDLEGVKTEKLRFRELKAVKIDKCSVWIDYRADK